MSLSTVSESNHTRILHLFAPDLKVKKLLTAAIAIPGFLLCCLVAIILPLSPSKGEMSNGAALAFILAFILLPLATVLMSITALREPHHPPRTLMWLAAAGFILTAGLIVATMMLLDPELETVVPLVFLLIVIAPVALVISMPAIYSIAKTVPEVRAALKSAAEERALGYIGTRGALSFGELSILAGIPMEDVNNTVDGLLYAGKLQGTMDLANGMIFTAAYLAEQQRELLESVNLHGRVKLGDLAALLKTSSVTVTEWIYQLVQRGQFSGYVNWRKGLVYAATGKKIGADSQCPECGGSLTPGGGQRIVCLHCGTELWDRG